MGLLAEEMNSRTTTVRATVVVGIKRGIIVPKDSGPELLQNSIKIRIKTLSFAAPGGIIYSGFIQHNGAFMDSFKLVSQYRPTGDQPQAIDALVSGIENGLDEQVLLGVTGSGKTFTMANVIARFNRPTLVLAHNKTLAAQLCSEFKEFFPENAVEYFVSYYDYYQPEAYIPHTDTYIEKDCSINDEIDRLRLSATFSLLERRDVIVVASVSCIYGLGEPDDFANMAISMRPGQSWNMDELLHKLIEARYERNDIAFERNMFRVRGDTVEIFPAYWNDRAIRVEFFGDEIDRLSEINVVTGAAERYLTHAVVYPASHYVTTKEKMAAAIERIRTECDERVRYFTDNNKLIEAQRIKQRTDYDIDMMQELGYCTGIENYSRVISNRPVGSPPMTLLDYFPKDFLPLCGREPCHAAAGARDVPGRPRAQGGAGGVRLPPALCVRQPPAEI